MRRYNYILLLLTLGIFSFLTACSTIKTVPDGQYLLNKTRVQVNGAKDVRPADMSSYLRQKPNSEVFGFWKMQLNIYNWAGADTSKWINRALHRMGEAPEIYDSMLTEASMEQLQKAMANKGYLNATVDTTLLIPSEKKINVTYNITANQPYTLRDYKVTLPNEYLQRLALRRNSRIESGMLFDANVLEEERVRIANLMRNNGYYYFEKDFLRFLADSALNSHEVDLEIRLQDYIETASEEDKRELFKQFVVSKIVFFTEYDKSFYSEADVDTVMRGDYVFINAGKPLIRQRVLMRSCKFEPGDLYDERKVEQTYQTFNSLGPVKYVNISFQQIAPNELACIIAIAKDKTHSVSAEVEGTYSGGDWGVGAGVGYTNRNAFRGGEEWNITARGSYEWRGNGSRNIEGKVETGLRFPNNLDVNLSGTFQQRPDEFMRMIANAGLQYSLKTNRNRWKHYFTPIDISYVYLPWIAPAFSEQFLRPENILRYSYEDHFIVGWSYAGNYSSKRANQPLRDFVTIQYGVETAGNLLYGLSHLFNFPKDEEGDYRIFNIRYAQYAKADFQLALNQVFTEKHRLVWHLGFGVAVPFGNANTIPFEKRYYAGGANSVRGWTIRSLGPGGYRSNGSRIDYNNQAGDIKLDLNLEYRAKIVGPLELAAFTDAGNIWTIDSYDSQPHGQFTKNFYKEIAWSYGVGVRLDFSFFVFRVDFGVKLYDPSYLYLPGAEQKVWRTAPNGLSWKDDMTFHFAIGYPF